MVEVCKLDTMIVIEIKGVYSPLDIMEHEDFGASKPRETSSVLV